MTPLMEYLLEEETAVVFDVDGVLAVYEFGMGHSACPDGDWERYVREQDPYASAMPVEQIQRFVQHKGAERVFACSVAADYECEGKRDFVTREYAIPAEHVRMVDSKDAKLAYLEEVRGLLGVEQRRVALVEDTVSTLDRVYESSSFTTVHVSSFFAF